MKKLIVFSFLAFFAVPTIAEAQQMMIGARWGVNFADQHYSTLPPTGESISGRTLGLVGGQLVCPFNNTWAVIIQLLYDEKGSHADMGVLANGPSGYYATADWTTSYLEIPLLVKLSSNSGTVRPYIFAGPSLGFMLSNIETLQSTGIYDIPNGVGAAYRIDTTANISNYTEPIDISLIAGAGISVTLASGQELFLDAAYAFGLTNSDNYSWDNNDGIYVYSRDIRIAAGVMFPIR